MLGRDFTYFLGPSGEMKSVSQFRERAVRTKRARRHAPCGFRASMAANNCHKEM